MGSRPLKFEWVAAWRDDPRLTPPVRLLLFALADRMDPHTGLCWPSIRQLAADTGYSERHVNRLVKEAVATGWLSVKRGARSSHRSNDYLADFPAAQVIGDPDISVSDDLTQVSAKEQEKPRKRKLTGNGGSDRAGVEIERADMKAAVVESLESRSVHFRGVLKLHGFRQEDASWVLTEFERLRSPIIGPGRTDAAELVAGVLVDLSTKSLPFTRKRFTGFIESAIRFRDGVVPGFGGKRPRW